MLHVPSPDGLISAQRPLPADAEPVRALVAAIRRHWWLPLLAVATALAIATWIVATTQPVFQASARVLFDPRRADANRSATDRELLQFSIDAAQIESQIQLLRSDQVRRAVIDAHRLAEDPELTSRNPSAISRARGLLSSLLGNSPPTSEATEIPAGTRYGLVMNELDQRLDIRRLGQSYVLQVTYHSTDPEKAARLANAITAAYIALQVAPRIDSARRTGHFERSIRELNSDSEALSQAVRTGVIDVNAFPASEARVIAAALPPLNPSGPRTMLVLAFAGSLGLLIGGVAAIARHHRSRTIDDERQLEALLGVPSLGAFGHSDEPFADPLAARRRKARQRRFASAMREIRSSFEIALRSPRSQCVGVTATSRGEGASLLAFQLALAFAAAGRRTILIDANTLNPALTYAIAPAALGNEEEGLIEALGDGNIERVMLPPSGRLFFMPIGREHRSVHMSDFVEAPQARELFDTLRAKFDRVVIDLPAVSALPDASAFGLNLDSYVLVVDAGRTRQADAAEAVALLASSASIAGAVLNTRKR